MKVELLIEIECGDYLCGECMGLDSYNEICGYLNRCAEPGDVTNQFERLPECMEAAAKAKGLRDKLEAVRGVRVLMSEPPGPESQFVEVENATGESICAGHWDQEDDLWVLTLSELPDAMSIAAADPESEATP